MHTGYLEWIDTSPLSAILPTSQLAPLLTNTRSTYRTMPNLRNAKKALRQSDKRAQRNKIAKAEIKSLRVKLRKALTASNLDEAKSVAQLVGKKLDKAVKKNIFKKNTVARYKSRMMKKINALKNA